MPQQAVAKGIGQRLFLRHQLATSSSLVTKTFSGITRAVFTQADNYVVQIHRPLEEPLRSLVVAAAVSVDTALKQDARGFN